MTRPILCFTSSPGGSAFMTELLEVVADAVVQAGGEAVCHHGPLPEADRRTVFVVVPHEFFVVTPVADLPTAWQRARTIGLVVEHPGTRTFESSVVHAGGLGARVDINEDSRTELERRGLPTHRFQLGYSRIWDRWGGATAARPTDVTYMGTVDPRRSRILAEISPEIVGWSSMILTPPHEPMVSPRPDFLMGRRKWDHLASSKVLLNLHREGSQALEWVRILESVCNGCVVVSEHSVDVEPLVPGSHLLVGRPSSLGVIADALLRHEERLESVRGQAYAFCRESLDMTASAVRLIELAAELVRVTPGTHPASPNSSGFTASWSPGDSKWDQGYGPPTSGRIPAVGSPDRPMMEDPPIPRRFLMRPSSAADRLAARAFSVATIAARSSLLSRPVAVPPHLSDQQGRGQIDVVVVSDSGMTGLSSTLDSLCAQTLVPRRVLIGLDGGGTEPAAPEGPGLWTSDDGTPIETWTRCHTVSAGRGYCRNRLLELSDAEWILLVDAGQQLLPPALERMRGALTANNWSATYSMVASSSVGLYNVFPPEVVRLARHPYLGTPILCTRRALVDLGGFTENPLADPLVDHNLWVRLTAHGVRAGLVPQVLAADADYDSLPELLDVAPDLVWAEANGRRPNSWTSLA